jgi:SagB-type dehydrogenase family enzyme
MPNLQASIAQHYHERTKYDPDTINAKSKPLDWQQQPLPFKEYRIGMPFDLKVYLQLDRPDPGDAEEAWWTRLSRFLYASYGLTGMIPTYGEPHYLRSAPSAGGLYPAELYLVSRGTPYLPPGLYNYQAKTHSLMHFWESDVWTKLQAACFWHPNLEATELALVVSTVFERSAWRYQDRAYRRICLDTGHLLGNLELAGSLTDFRPHLIGGFADEAVNQTLYLEPQEESAIAVLPLADVRLAQQNLPLARTTLPSQTQTDYSRRIADGNLWSSLQEATQIPFSGQKIDWQMPRSEPAREDKYNFPFCLRLPTRVDAIAWGDALTQLESTLLKRRSTRTFSGGALKQAELLQILDFTYHPQHYMEQEFDRAPDFFDLTGVETFVVVSGIDGMEEGCYYYAPQSQELRQIRFKNFRRELHFLCLGQDLGRDAAAVVFHTANLDGAIASHGDRAYRYLHMDAGHLGQRINVAAVKLGLGASGIGGFFDDQVNQVLGIPEDEAVLYITTLGRPRRG